ncbi:SURF1 family protein [Variovorax ginsengisoli]|uniref:SURF1-like protein n=1 Tax=Variovorax ginsengisoli TaxID=363844 RepID=A0ABT8S1M3_9BURK|nr:SURF1 family protein [Variovorax ginsengisoli]MDN8612707.1 SURF1 family protein [Variovorax ginsengisoli]MDO1531877.1 SURF1 family protein [Variovorax ginsengisoli]
MRRLLPRLALALCALSAFAGFFALGTWQLERRAWKLDLIERVDQRVHAPAVDAPGPGQWPRVNRADDEYRHVRATGRFLHDRETLVQATTELGSGYWVLTPLRMADGRSLLVNRGFVSPAQQKQRAARRESGPAEPAEAVTVTGLLRMTEPRGALLRDNDPGADRWYSRDVMAIAQARGLSDVAPYFVDADAVAAAPGGPVGGLTVIAFPNNHLVYALTWYALALMVAGATWIVVRQERHRAEEGSPDGTHD